MTERTAGFGRQLLAAFAGDLGTNTEIESLRAENTRLKRQLDRATARGDRYRDRHDRAAHELSEARATLMKVSTVKCWTNEDGKRFVFVTDLQEALAVPTDTGGQ